MHRLPRSNRFVSYVVVTAFLWVSLPLPAAHAALVGTDTAVGALASDAARAQLQNLLDREDVREQLLARGVSPEAVQARVDSLTDQEVQTLAAHMNELPAGGSALGVIALLFLVLLFTDLMGWTDVFPFTKKGSARQ